MPSYRRWWTPGGTFFFTQVTERRAPILCEDAAREMLHDAVARTQSRWPFEIVAWVLLPDHMHAIWALPAGDDDYATRWGYLKKEFTKAWIAAGGQEQTRSVSRVSNGRRGVWQRHFWEHLVRDEREFSALADYIHHNPIKHGFAVCAHDWKWSTYHRWVRDGRYDLNWCCRCRSELPTVLPQFGDNVLSAVGE